MPPISDKKKNSLINKGREFANWIDSKIERTKEGRKTIFRNHNEISHNVVKTDIDVEDSEIVNNPEMKIIQQMGDNLFEQLNIISKAYKSGLLNANKAEKFTQNIKKEAINLRDIKNKLQKEEKEPTSTEHTREVSIESRPAVIGRLPFKKRKFIDLTINDDTPQAKTR